MKNLIIDRNTWRKGGSKYNEQCGETRLLNNEGFMCCLGFFCKQAGVPEKYLNTGEPCDIDIKEYTDLIPELVTYHEGNDVYKNTHLTEDAINKNDNPNFTNEERETHLTKLFKDNNIDVEFINNYPE